MTIRITPSLAAAPLEHLSQTIGELADVGIDGFHFDIEDGLFVPAMTLGIKVIGDLRPFTNLPFDVHLMIANPEWMLPHVIKAGANRVSVHYEACSYPRRILQSIVLHGAQAGIALNPRTSLPDLRYLSPYLSFVVILSTEPEIKESPFLPNALEKVRAGKKTPGLEVIEWVVDGGVIPENISEIAEAGADSVVVGRAIFRDNRIRDNLAALRAAL